MIAPSEYIKQAFLAAGLVTDGAQDPKGIWACYLSSMPPEPDNSVCIYDTMGIKDGRYMKDENGGVLVHPGVMVHVRSQGYVAGWNKGNQLIRAIDLVKNSTYTVGGISQTITSINRNNGVIPMGSETIGTKRRDMFSINLLMTFRN